MCSLTEVLPRVRCPDGGNMRFYKFVLLLALVGLVVASVGCKTTWTKKVNNNEVGFIVKFRIGDSTPNCAFVNHVSDGCINKEWIDSGPYAPGEHEIDLYDSHNPMFVTVGCGTAPIDTVFGSEYFFELTEDGHDYREGRPGRWHHVYAVIKANAIVSCADPAMLKRVALECAYEGASDPRLNPARAVLDDAVRELKEAVIPGCVKDGLPGYSKTCAERIIATARKKLLESKVVDPASIEIEMPLIK